MPSNSKSLSEILDKMFSDDGASPAPSFDEEKFRSWYGGMAEQYSLDSNPDDPKHFYDYRKAFTAGAAPDEQGHWPSEFKKKGHPRQIVKGVDTRTGERVFPETKYDNVISQAAEKHGVPYEIMYRLLLQESRFNPKAVSPKGAQGIAQFMPDTAKSEGLRDPFDPTQAIPASARYLKKQYDRFGDWKLAAAAYNAGPGNVEKYKGVPPFAETQDYVKKLFPEDEEMAELAEVESPSLDQLLDNMFPEDKVVDSVKKTDTGEIEVAGVEASIADRYFTSKAVVGTVPIPVVHPAIAAKMSMMGLGPQPSGGFDEIGRPLNAQGKPYIIEGEKPKDETKVASTRPHGIYANPEKKNFIRRAADQVREFFGIEGENKLSDAARAQAVVRIMAAEEGMPLDQYRQSPEFIEKAASSFVNVASFGMLPAIRESLTGEEDFESTNMEGYVGSALGSLAGLVFTPVGTVKQTLNPVIKYLPQATQEGRLAGRILKAALHDAVILGPATGLTALGEAAKSITFSEAADKVWEASVSGALTGAAFGFAKGMFPKDAPVETVTRVVTGLVALNAVRYMEMGGKNPFTDRPIGEVLFDVGLDVLFSYKGLPKGRFAEFAKEIDQRVKDRQAFDIKKKILENAPPEEVAELIKKRVLEVERERLQYKEKQFADEFNNDLIVIEEMGLQAELKAKMLSRPVVESRPEMAEGKWTEEGKTERRSTKYVPASEEATKKNFPPSKDIDALVNRYRMGEKIWVDEQGNHRIDNYKDAAKIAREQGGTVLPTTEGKWAVALEPQKRVKYELDAIKSEPIKEGAPEKPAVPTKEELKREKVKKDKPVKGKKKDDIPELKLTQDAVAFGEKATPGQLAEIERRSGEIKDQVNELVKSADFESRAQEITDLAYKAQLYNEALQASRGEHPSQLQKGAQQTVKKINDLAEKRKPKEVPFKPGDKIRIKEAPLKFIHNEESFEIMRAMGVGETKITGPAYREILRNTREFVEANYGKEGLSDFNLRLLEEVDRHKRNARDPKGVSELIALDALIQKRGKPANIPQRKKGEVVILKKKGEKPKVEEKPKEAESEVDEVIPEERLKMLDRIIEDVEAEASRSKPKPTEPVTEVDRATGSGPGVEKSNGIFFQNKEEAAAFAKIFNERKKQVEADPEIYLQKLINDVNRWYHGENIDIKATREALSTLAGKASEMREFFMAGVDHIQFVDIASEAAKWARSVGRPKAGIGGDTQLNMMIPLDKIPGVVKGMLEVIHKELKGPEKHDSFVQFFIANNQRLYRNREIWEKTGFWAGRDGKWRYEIDPTELKYHPNKFMMDKYTATGYTTGKLAEIIYAPTLYKKFPELQNFVIEFNKDMTSNGEYVSVGRLAPGLIRIKSIGDKTAIVHEIQHAVQDIAESRFKGSSIEVAGSFENYWKDPGEMEARLTTIRMNMTKAERMSEAPWETLDKMLQREGDLFLGKHKVPFRGTDLYSGVPVDQIPRLVKSGWKALKENQDKLFDDISKWLSSESKEMPRPSGIYRGVSKGRKVDDTLYKEGYLHGTPWEFEAARGGKSVFGDPSSHDVYMIDANKDIKYHRGGSLSGDPLERTRIDSSKGMTWEDILNKGKELYYQDLAKERARENKFGRELTSGDLKRIARDVAGDIKSAAFEADLRGKEGIWSEFGPDRDLSRSYPKLRSTEVIEEVARRKREEGFTDEQIPELKILERSGIKLYSGVPVDKAAADLIAGARKIHDYMKKARGMKEFKPAEAAKLIRAEFNKGFIDRSGNLRVELLDQLGDKGYEVVQKMYLAKGASSRAASMLKQMGGEVYEGLSRAEREVLDALILSDRMIDIGKTRGEKEFNYPGGAKLVDFVTYSELFPHIEKINPIRAELIRKRAAAYFDWMKKPLAEMLEAGLISKEEFDKLSKHQYRRIKLVDIYDKRYGSTIGGRKRTVYDSGVEALSRGKGTDIYEPSSEVMALEVYNRAYGRIYNNAANQVLADIAKTNPDNPFVRIKENKGDKIPSGWHRVFYYEGGSRKSMHVNPEFSSEWITRSPEISYKMAQIIRHTSGSSVLRTFATGIDWGFALANLPRDVMHAWFAAREFRNGKWQPTYSTFAPTFGTQMTIDMSTIFRDATTRKGRYLDYINEGGGMEFLVHQGRLLQRGRHLEGNIDKIYNFMGYLGETTEIMTRLAIRERVIKNRAREQGISVEQARKNKKITQEATFAARDYMDFGQGGSISKAVDNGIPYLNAAIQGTRGMFRSFKGGSGFESTAKLAQLAAITTGVYLATMYNAPETFKQLKGVEDSKNNLIIPLGDDFGFLDEYGQMRYPYFKIPLDPGQKFFKTFFEGATDKWLGNEVDVDRITEALKEQAPVDISQLPPTMSAAFGYMYNKDFWRNEDIFSGANESFSWPHSAAEFDKNTPEIYKDLGAATGLSPERTKYAVEQLFTKNSMWKALGGKAYDTAFSDLPKSQKEQHLAKMLSETPVLRRFIGVTNPYSKHATKIEQAEERSIVNRFVQSRDMDIVVEKYLYDKTATIEDVIDEARKHKDLDIYNRLIERFKWEAAIVGLPEKSFWKRLKGLNPEAKAEIFVHRLNKANEAEKEQLWTEFSIVAGAGDIVTDSFRREVFRIMGDQ